MALRVPTNSEDKLKDNFIRDTSRRTHEITNRKMAQEATPREGRGLRDPQ